MGDRRSIMLPLLSNQIQDLEHFPRIGNAMSAEGRHNSNEVCITPAMGANTYPLCIGNHSRHES